jgi:hypothetical protein
MFQHGGKCCASSNGETREAWLRCSSLKGERIGVQSTRSAWKLIISSPLIEEAPGKSRSIKMQNTESTRHAMYVKRNIEARSRNHCCSGKAKSITYWCVCVAERVHRSGRVLARV